MNAERWAAILGYRGRYEVSTLGRVRRLATVNAYGRRLSTMVMKTSVTTSRYQVAFLSGGSHRAALVHRLVAVAFIPNPEGLPVVNHIDGNKMNNTVENLEWCTTSHNAKHAIATGLNTRPPLRARARLSEQDVLRIRLALQSGALQKHLAVIYGVVPSTIGHIKRGTTWGHVTPQESAA